MLGMAAGYLGLVDGLSDERDRALEDRLAVRKESRLQCSGHRGKTLGTGDGWEERKEKHKSRTTKMYLSDTYLKQGE